MNPLFFRSLGVLGVFLTLSIFVRISSAQWCDCSGFPSAPPPTNTGTEFLLVFMQNESPAYNQTSPSTYQDVYIAALDKAAEVTITCKAYSGFSETLMIPARGSIRYRLTEKIDALMQSNEVVDQTVVKVVSDEPIICYGLNHKYQTADAFLAYPVSSAQTEYMVMSYTNSPSTAHRSSEFSVAAFQDNTIVEIIPASITASGSPKGQKLTYVLNSGEGVQIHAANPDNANDLSGSIVHSTKPIVVYGGHVRTEISLSEGTNRDHLAEAMPPIATWGRHFITGKIIGRENPFGDLVRVTALNDSTIISIDGVRWGASLMSGESRDTIVQSLVAIEASDQVLTGLLPHTSQGSMTTGDPFLAIVPPLNQTYNDFAFIISDDEIYDQEGYIQIVTERSGVGTISLQGNLIPAAGFTDMPGTMGGKQWSTVTLNVPAGIHRISTPNTPEKGFTILAYGFGPVDSYGYTAGALLRPMNGIRGGLLEPPAPQVVSHMKPQAHLRSILNQKVFLDSAKFTHSHADKYTVSLRNKNIWSELTAGEKKSIDLLVTPPNTDDVITGTMRVWHHTIQHRTMWPVDVPFTIYPQTAASVSEMTGSAFAISTFPNPATGDMLRINFTLPERTMIHARLIDVTGREAAQIIRGVVSEGMNTFTISTRNIANGMYMCEISAPELGISERKQVVVMK